MFGGKTKRDLYEAIYNLSRAYDFIDAYAENQKKVNNGDSVGFQEARSVMSYIYNCLNNLKSIDGDPSIWAYTTPNTHKYSKERLPNMYTAVFANPNAPTSTETSKMLMKIQIKCDSARRSDTYEGRQYDDLEEANKLIHQYCQMMDNFHDKI